MHPRKFTKFINNQKNNIMNNTRTTIVKNILSKKEYVFVNNKSLTENIINVKILITNKTSQLLNEEERTKQRAGITETKSKITNELFAFCIHTDLIAHYEN